MKANGHCAVLFFNLCILTLDIQPVNGQSYSDVSALKTTLLTGYDRDIIPVLDQTTTMKVNVTLYLYNILDVNGVQGSVLMPLMTVCTWMDEKLTWTPASHNGVSKVAFYQNEVWKPPISLGTPIEFVIMENSLMHVVVQSNGMAMMQPGNIIESACNFNMKYWPFDKQVCDVSFWAYDVDPSQVALEISDDGIVSTVTSNAEWVLEEYTSFKRSVGMMNEVVFRLHLKRQAGFYVLTIIMPICGLALLGAMVFLLPHDSGERVGFSITVMLSLSVFLTVIADQMPKTSDPLPLITLYITVLVISGILETMVVLLNMRYFHKEAGDNNIPMVYRKMCGRLKKGIFSKNKVHDESYTHRVKSVSKVSEALENEDDDEDVEASVTWKDVFQTIDMMSFWFFFLLTVFSSVICLAVVATGATYEAK